jgi:hypothetical protein
VTSWTGEEEEETVENKKTCMMCGMDFTYPTILAGCLTGHTWQETGSFAVCHLKQKLISAFSFTRVK